MYIFRANAVYPLPESVEKNSVELDEQCLRVLVTSVLSVTNLFFREMLKKKQGPILTVSSVVVCAPPAARQVMYGPLKTFMNRFSQALNMNYNSFGIKTTALCPGYVNPSFI